MKNIILLLTAVILLLGSVPTRSDIALQRTTLTVNDLPATLGFYRDLLGFTVRSEADYGTPALRAMFHVPKGVTPRLVLLDAGPDQPRALALVQAEGLSVDVEANRRGAPALVLNTRTLDEIHQRLVAADVTVVWPPTELKDFQGKPFGREAMYLDPDGVRVVLFEYVLAGAGAPADMESEGVE